LAGERLASKRLESQRRALKPMSRSRFGRTIWKSEMPARKSSPDDTQTSKPDSAGDTTAGAEAKQSDASRNKKLATRVAVGIGSAAIVAALLYAGRNKIGDRDK
jgi:hypothetical protein